MIIQIDKRHPKLKSRYGKDCADFKQPPTDIDFKSRCDACKKLCFEEYRICRPAPKKPKAKIVDIGLKIKRRKKKPKPKPKQEKPQSYETCKGPLEENCEKCPKFPACLFKIKEDGKQPIELYSKLLHFITDKYMKKCTGLEWKVFCYLNRRADWRPDSNNFGQCYPAYKTIAKEVGCSKAALEQYSIKNLEALGLIDHTPVRRGKNVTTNNFTITWFKRIKELRKKLAHN